METKRQLDVLDQRLAENEYLAGIEYTIADGRKVKIVFENSMSCSGYEIFSFHPRLNSIWQKNICLQNDKRR